MGKRGKPKRIIRCSKPTVCPECGNRKFLIVVYGMPTQKVWDDTGRYDCRGCCLPPFVEVVDHKDGNIYHCPEPKYVCSKKRCSLEVYLREEAEIMPPIDDSSYFYGSKWIEGDFVIQSQQAARLRNKVWENGGNGEEALQKAFKTKTIRQLHQLQRELLGCKNKD
jgi:hypothetical protein